MKVKEKTMKRMIVIIWLLGMLICLGALFAETRGAKIISVLGVVKVQHVNDSHWVRAKMNMYLNPQDKIRTELGSETRVKLMNGSLLRIEENTIITLNRLSKSTQSDQNSIKVWSGSVYAKVRKLTRAKSTFEIATPTVIAGVRGTSLVANVQNAIGKISSDPENAPGSIIVYVPGDRTSSMKLKPGKAAVGKTDGTLQEEELSKNEKLAFEEMKKEADALLKGKPPALSIKGLKAKHTFSGSTLKLSGRSEKDAEVKLLINGKEVQSIICEKDIFKFEVEHGGKEGDELKVEIIAVNKYGLTASLQTVIKIVEKKVMLRIDSPRKDAIELQEDILSISGSSDPGAMIKIQLNDTDLGEIQCDKDGNFLINFNIKDFREEMLKKEKTEKYKTVLTVTAVADGRMSTSKKTVTLLRKKLDLELTSPKTDLITDKDTLDVAGKTEKNAKVVILLNEKKVTEMTADSRGNFIAQVDLSEHLNKIPVTITVIAQKGQSTVKAVRVVEYTVEVKIIKFMVMNMLIPPYITSGEVEIQGEYSPAHALFMINGKEVKGENGIFTYKLSLSDGEHSITGKLLLNDEVVEVSERVIIDTVLPEITEVTIIDPNALPGMEADVIISPFVTIRVTVPEDTAYVLINGRDAYSTGSGIFEGGLTAQKDGDIQLAIKATDQAGNEYTAPERTLHAEVEPPKLFIYEPARLPVLRGNTKAGCSLYLYMNGVLVISGEESVSGVIDIDLSTELSGLEQTTAVDIKIITLDKYKRESIPWTKSFIYDTLAPSIISFDYTVQSEEIAFYIDLSEECEAILLYTDGYEIKRAQSDSLGHAEISLDIASIIKSSYNRSVLFKVRFTDVSGNVSEDYNLSDYGLTDMSYILPPLPPD
ncbi:FecR domain-containing protein [Spirochaetota bacterium]